MTLQDMVKKIGSLVVRFKQLRVLVLLDPDGAIAAPGIEAHFKTSIVEFDGLYGLTHCSSFSSDHLMEARPSALDSNAMRCGLGVGYDR